MKKSKRYIVSDNKNGTTFDLNKYISLWTHIKAVAKRKGIPMSNTKAQELAKAKMKIGKYQDADPNFQDALNYQNSKR